MQETPERQAWMGVLALSPWSELQARARDYAETPCEVLRGPETGLVMLRGKMGGSGPAFNLGEATVTRCALRLGNNIEGHAYVLGRNHLHARLAALCDALLQSEVTHAEIQTNVIGPLMSNIESQRKRKAAKTAATKVEFFTMVRGDAG